jgi:MFS family permease
MPIAVSQPSLKQASMDLSQWKMVILASLGGGLEFYDFIIYGVFAQYIAAAFFPASDPIVSLILTFTVFATGYLTRPIGGVVMGHFGDRYGRKNVFVLSVFVMSACTFGLGLVPAYAQGGLAATVLFVALRLIQGLCLGGELPGAITYVAEVAPQRPGFACSVVFCFATSGVLFAALVNWGVQATLAAGNVAAYGWRIAFLIGGVLGLAGFWLRRSLEETPEFQRMHEIARAARSPIAEVIRRFPVAVLIGIGTTALTAGFNGILFAYMPAYLGKTLGYAPAEIAPTLNATLFVMSISVLAVGLLTDKVRRFLPLRFGSVGLLLYAYPMFTALASGHANLLAVLLPAGVLSGFANGSFAVLLADLYPTKVRFSGIALSYNISFLALSGTAPLFAASLIAATGDRASPAWLVIGCAALSLLASFWMPRHGGRIAEIEPTTVATQDAQKA